MADEPDVIPTSRLRRLSKIGGVAASTAARTLGTRAANLTRSEEAALEAMERRQLETAERIVAVLGTMKGAAMKLGQVMSFLDVGLVPAEFRDDFQAKLAELRDAAPKVAFKDMKRVIEAEYGEPIERVFQSFDPVPIAAASIGQVYRARLEDGRDVAVKVQYPGVAAAVRADMQNLGVILRLMRGVAPGLDANAMATEIRDRIEEELDYELEAQNQRRLARVFRGHPFILVPEVVTALSHERVVVSEYVEGRGFEEMKQLDQAERDRLGEIVFRFYFGCMYRFHQFSGDPHPGNCLLMDDGRMAFLDFGLFKRIAPAVAEFELETQRLGHRRDGAALLAKLHEGGLIAHPEDYTEAMVLEMFDAITGWYTSDGVRQLEPEYATEVMITASDPRSPYFGSMRHETLPAEHLFGRRVEILTLAVLSQLRARGDWHAIAREWIFGASPVTRLGRQEAEFLASR